MPNSSTDNKGDLPNPRQAALVEPLIGVFSGALVSYIRNLMLRPNTSNTEAEIILNDGSVKNFIPAQFASESPIVMVQVQGTADEYVFVTFDGVNPIVGSRGFAILVGETLNWHVDTLLAAKFIRSGSNNIRIVAQGCLA